MPKFYVSFADPRRPKGSQWLGWTFLEADSLESGLQEFAEHPGGEVAAWQLSDSAPIPDFVRGRILGILELKIIDEIYGGDGTVIRLDDDSVPEPTYRLCTEHSAAKNHQPAQSNK